MNKQYTINEKKHIYNVVYIVLWWNNLCKFLTRSQYKKARRIEYIYKDMLELDFFNDSIREIAKKTKLHHQQIINLFNVVINIYHIIRETSNFLQKRDDTSLQNAIIKVEEYDTKLLQPNKQ